MSDDIHALSGAYALDALDQHERARFEEHLELCHACRVEVAELAEVAADLGAAVPEDPPTALRSAVLAAIDEVRPLPPTGDDGTGHRPGEVVPLRRRRIVSILAAVAATLVLLAGGALVVSFVRSSRPTPTAAAVLSDPGARRITQDLGSFSATLVVSEAEDRAVIVSDDMPPAPEGRSYQLWYERPGKGMVSAGIMPPSDDGQEVLLEGEVSDATAVGVTVEPAGGSPKPTSAPIAVIRIA